MIRTAWVLVAGTVLTMLYASRVIVQAMLRRPGMQCFCDGIGRRWCRRLLRLAGVRVRILDADRRDWNGPAVVVANHQSWFDVFAMTAYFPGHVRFIAKEELGRIPIFGTAWKACGHVSINRSDRRRAIQSLNHAAQRVRDESLTMVLFPEGTRSPDGRLQDFKKGAFVLAIKTGVPIVPVAISGSREVMPKASWRVSPGEIHIRVGEAIPVEGLAHADRGSLRERSRSAVAALMSESHGSHEHRGATMRVDEEPTTGETKETSE